MVMGSVHFLEFVSVEGASAAVLLTLLQLVGENVSFPAMKSFSFCKRRTGTDSQHNPVPRNFSGLQKGVIGTVKHKNPVHCVNGVA